jgi:hypothetical protein
MLPYVLPFLLAVGAISSAAGAQCVDPPHDGNFVEHADQIVAFTDNYRTYMDVRIPAVPPGPCGWPMVVLVHGGGASRDIVNPKARIMASRGFVTVTYDVRGQGLGMQLNDPRFYGREIMGMRERLDLFEIMEEAERLFPNSIDMDRIGVTGRSQGAFHSFLAAAHSGKTFPANPWRSAPAPVIRAVAPINIGPEHLNGLVPESQNFSEMMARQIFEDENVSGLHNNPVIYDFLEPFLLAEDYQGLVSTMYNPALDLRLLLQDSEVSILAQLAWDDKFGAINELASNWDSYLLPGTRKFLNHSVTGHGTPVNVHERLSTEYRRILFFEEELKGMDRGISNWAPYRFAITPLETADYIDAHRIWDVIESDVYPLAGTTNETVYLGGNYNLVPTPPSGPQNYSISHQSFGLTLQHYLDELPAPEELVQGAPMDTVEFVMQPLQEDVLMLGEPKVKLNLGSLDENLQIGAALVDHSTGRYLTSAFTTIRGHIASEPIEIELTMSTCGVFLPKGTQLRLELRNLAWHNIPGRQTFLRALPVFSDFEVGILAGGPTPAYLQLPLVEYKDPILTYSYPFLLRASNPKGDLALRCYDRSTAGWTYQILAGFSGTTPGTSHMGTHVPLNVDLLTNMIYTQPSSLPIQDFSGNLNFEAEAAATTNLGTMPGIPYFVQQLDFVAVIVDPSGTQARVSNVVHLEFD